MPTRRAMVCLQAACWQPVLVPPPLVWRDSRGRLRRCRRKASKHVTGGGRAAAGEAVGGLGGGFDQARCRCPPDGPPTADEGTVEGHNLGLVLARRQAQPVVHAVVAARLRAKPSQQSPDEPRRPGRLASFMQELGKGQGVEELHVQLFEQPAQQCLGHGVLLAADALAGERKVVAQAEVLGVGCQAPRQLLIREGHAEEGILRHATAVVPGPFGGAARELSQPLGIHRRDEQQATHGEPANCMAEKGASGLLGRKGVLQRKLYGHHVLPRKITRSTADHVAHEEARTAKCLRAYFPFFSRQEEPPARLRNLLLCNIHAVVAELEGQLLGCFDKLHLVTSPAARDVENLYTGVLQLPAAPPQCLRHLPHGPLDQRPFDQVVDILQRSGSTTLLHRAGVLP
mmetsp:Transcript_88122/g.213740  ORF Transcript_88122/g.213740 Transcript_88122/m.213740 type:complete len:400 (-) Transcript_88122:568-1767(-)